MSNKQIANLRMLLIGALVLLTTGVVLGYVFKRWEWYGTGFNQASLWHWLDLLIVPGALAIGVPLINREQRTQKQLEISQRKREQQLEEQRAQHARLQTYHDQMGNLLLNQQLREQPANSDVRRLAQARTRNILSELDPYRKQIPIRLLHELSLIDADEPILDISDADLSDADLSEVSLHKAYLRGANLGNANLSAGDLREADLSEANLSYANVREANLINANLINANLSGADLSGAKNLTQEQINSAYGDETTQLPDHLQRPAHWSKGDEETEEC